MKRMLFNSFIFLAIWLLSACSETETSTDTGLSDITEDISFEDVPNIDNYVPSTRPPTTVKRTVKAELPIAPQDKSLSDKFGKYSYVNEGEKHIVREDLGAPKGSGKETSFFYMVHLSDLHITDFQSPDRMTQFDSPSIPTAYRPHEGYALRILNEFIKTINDFNYFHMVDLLLISGDGVDNNQYNEFKWLITVLTGGSIDPNSGGYKTLLEGDDNEVCDPLIATGTDIPWVYVLGNHDQLIVGNFLTVNRALSPDEQAEKIKENNYYKKAIGDTSECVIACKYPVDTTACRSGKVNSNLERRPLIHRDVTKMFYEAPGNIKGHGFNKQNVDTDSANYTYDPDPNIPLRFIVLDTGNPNGMANGFLSQRLFDEFLTPALEKALSDKVLVIVSSHHPSWSIDSKSEKSGEDLINLLNSYPNVILHLVGHGHEHRIIAHKSLDNNLEKGYYEIEAPSTLDFPQQGNIYELVYTGDNTVSVYKTVFDHNSEVGSLPYIARSIAIADIQDGNNPDNGMGEEKDRNVILNIKIPTDISAKLEKLPQKEVESLNFYK